MSPKPKMNSERINVFFSNDVISKLKAIAAERGTSLSGIVRMIVLEYLAKM